MRLAVFKKKNVWCEGLHPLLGFGAALTWEVWPPLSRMPVMGNKTLQFLIRFVFCTFLRSFASEYMVAQLPGEALQHSVL